MNGGPSQRWRCLEHAIREYDPTYRLNEHITPAIKALADVEWDAIPSDPDDLRQWMRGEPVKGGGA